MTALVAIAGATGYTGQRLIAQLADHPRWRSRALVRAGSQTKAIFPLDQDFAICRLDDVADLTTALRGCSAVIQTIGTTQSQFKPGVSYETVDYGTTVALLQAAANAGVGRFLLLSSTGAGQPLGAYLKWKARTEKAVRESALDWTIVRPAGIVGPGRRAVQAGSLPFALLAKLPLLGRIGARLQAIEVADLARCFINCLDDDTTIKRTLEGRALWTMLK
jgi:uncharacterized protein YbjT (DUF2867 family)